MNSPEVFTNCAKLLECHPRYDHGQLRIQHQPASTTRVRQLNHPQTAATDTSEVALMGRVITFKIPQASELSKVRKIIPMVGYECFFSIVRERRNPTLLISMELRKVGERWGRKSPR